MEKRPLESASQSTPPLESTPSIVELKSLSEKIPRTSGLFFTVMNIMNTIIGSGVISLPRAFSEAGIGVCLLFMIVCSLLSDYTGVVLVKCSELAHLHTYQKVVQRAFGRPGYVIITLCQFIFTVGAVISYNVVICDNLQLVLKYFVGNCWLLENRLLVLLLPTVLGILPLSLLGDISFLDKFSALSILFSVTYIFVIFARSFSLSQTTYINPDTWIYAKSRFLESLSIISFAMACHHNIIPLYRSMRNKTVTKFSNAMHTSISISMFLFTLVAISGYVSFAGNVEGNLLNNYCSEDTYAIVCRLVFIITLILTAPLNVFAARESLNELIFQSSHVKTKFHLLIVIVLVVGMYVAGASVPKLEMVISITGSLVASPIIFIIPCVTLLKLMWMKSFRCPITVFMCVLTILFGVVLMFVGTILSVIHFFDPSVSYVKFWCDSTVSYSIPSFANASQLVDGFWRQN